MKLTNDKEKLLTRRKLIEKLFYIENKEQEIVPFNLNIIQDRYYRSRTQRDIILKSRQMGISSLILALWLVDCVSTDNTRAAIISYEDEATQRLLAKVQFYIDHLTIKPKLKYQSKHELYFPDTNSWFYIGTAGARVFGRGDTIHRLHCSEVAFWKDASTIMQGLLQSVPRDGYVVIESTANGIGNYFYNQWQRAKNEESRFKPHFYSWAGFPDYRLEDVKIELNDEERLLVQRFGLDMAQLAWRREKLKDFDTIEDFQQEYPLTDTEAFIVSGNPAFNTKALLSYKPKKGIRGELIDGKFEEKEKGRWTLFDTRRQPCLIGVDVAEGGETGDWSVIEAYNNQLEQIAEFRAKIDTDLLAEQVEEAGKFFSNPFIGIERNGLGLAVIQALKNKPLNLYYQQVFDERTGRRTQKIGWKTDLKTRPMMIAEFGNLIRDHKIKLNSQTLIDECLTFLRNNKGRYEAQEGCYDDTVMASAIAYQMYKINPVCDVISPSYERRHEPTPEEELDVSKWFNDEDKSWRSY